MFKDLNLLKELTSLNAIGGSIFDYFEDVGIKTVSLYGNDELIPIVFGQAYWSSIKISGVFSDREVNYQINVGEATRSNILKTTTNLSSENPVILLESPSRVVSNSFRLDFLINYSKIKRLLLDNLLNYKKKHPEVKILCFDIPSIWLIENRNPLESFLIRKYNSLESFEKKLVNKAIYSDLNKSKEYAKEMLAGQVFETIRNSENVSFLKDRNGKYANVINGYRVTTNVPEKAPHTIYTFGNSVAVGTGVDDENKLASIIQKTFNEYYKDDIPYRVLNAGNGGHPNNARVWDAILHHQPQNGDVIVLVNWFSKLFIDNPYYRENFTFFSPQRELNLFERPHEFGETIWVDLAHFSFIGNRILGKLLAEKIIETDENNHQNSTNDWSVELPIINDLTGWKARKLTARNYWEFVRRYPLREGDTGNKRWLQFKLKSPMYKGELYELELIIKYEKATKITPFFINEKRQISKLEKIELHENIWKKITLDYSPDLEDITCFSLTATDFVSTGSILSIGSIKISKKTF